MLDIPPHADGSIDARIQKTLFAMGDWLKVNGEAIFATKPWAEGPYGEGPTKISAGSFHEWPICALAAAPPPPPPPRPARVMPAPPPPPPPPPR